MISKTHLTGLVVILCLAISGCKSKKKGQTEQERRDSLEQVRRRDSLARVKRDRLARMRADSMEKAERDQTQKKGAGEPVSFTANGRYALQVGSWRSRVKAQKRVKLWKQRGYDSATVVQHGNEQTGDVWYRVRLGRMENGHQAKQLQKKIEQKYHEKSWIEIV